MANMAYCAIRFHLSNIAKVNAVNPIPRCAIASLALIAIPLPAAAASTVETVSTAPAATADAAAMPAIVDIWTANEGATLSDTLASWAERSGWKVIWETDSDFRLAAAGQFEGQFQDAAQRLIEAFGRTRPRLRATFYGGNSVLRVWAERAEP